MNAGKIKYQGANGMRKISTWTAIMLVVMMTTACSSSGGDSGVDARGEADAKTPLDLTGVDAARADSALPADVTTDEMAIADTGEETTLPPDDLVVDNGQAGPDLIDLPDEWVADTTGQGPDVLDVPESDLTDASSPDVAEEDITVFAELVEEDLPPEPEVVADIPLEEQQFAQPAMSTWVARKAKFQKPVQVSCRTLSGLGEIIDNPGTYDISFSAPDVEETDEGFLFPTPGTYTVTCADLDNDLEGTAEFVVAHDMLTPTLTQLSGTFSEQHALLDEALAAVKAEDDAALATKLAALKEGRIRASATVAAVAQTPPGGWPAQATIDQLVEAEPDDDAYILAVEALATTMVQLNLDIASLTVEPTLDKIGTVEESLASIREQTDALDALEVSDSARYAVRGQWDVVIAQIQVAQDTYMTKLEEILANADQWEAEPCPGCFTLVELVVSMAIQATLSALPSYNKLLIEAGKCAASMAVMLMISDAIDASVSGPDAPTIEYNMPGYGNAVNDGAALTLLVDGFDSVPGNNVVLFISPNIGDTVVNVVDAALSTMKAIKDLGNWDNVFELGGAIVDAYNALTGDLALMEEDIPGLMSNGVVPMPVLSVEQFMEPGSGFWEFMVNLPPLPECNDGWLPKVGLLVPINFQRGNGPSYKLVILP